MDRAPGGSGMEERGALGRALAELGIEAMVGECRVRGKGRATGAGHRGGAPVGKSGTPVEAELGG